MEDGGPIRFFTMLVDINTFLKPRLYVMDAITAMEGNGPRNGKPRQMNALMFSKDPIALDAIACKMVVLIPNMRPPPRRERRRVSGRIITRTLRSSGRGGIVCLPRLRRCAEPPVSVSEGNLRKFIRNRTTPRPVIDRAKCDNCGTCIKMCPVGHAALDWAYIEAGKAPRHNYANCIRCYCCQELCPQGAITIKRPVLSRLIAGAKTPSSKPLNSK